MACSSGGQSNCAISIIRISGFTSLTSLKKYFSFDLSNLKPKRATFCNFLENENEIDQVVITFFKGPHSYNGENILEIGCHGNVFNVRRILNALTADKKIRLSHPGEFTYRALKNKKMTLSQVEGLDLFLNAGSSHALNQGMGLLCGGLHNKYLSLRESFLKIKSSVELSIDFSEDVGDENALKYFKEACQEFHSKINGLFLKTQGNLSNLLNPSIVLLGQANSGKSTLFNQLLQENRSIVTSTAGTTRDYISEYIFIENNPFRLVDTAGLRKTDDSIEKMGIEKTLEQIEKSFYKILLVNPLEFDESELEKIKDFDIDLLIWTHIDRADFEKNYSKIVQKIKSIKAQEVLYIGQEENISRSGPIGPEKTNSGPIGPEQTNSGPIGPEQTNSGPIGPLQYISTIQKLVLKKYLKIKEHDPILVDRHRQLIAEINEEFSEFNRLVENCNDAGIISNEVEKLGHLISELIGIVSAEDVLENIFSNFCIGK